MHYYNYYDGFNSLGNNSAILGLVLLISLIGGIVLFFTFLNKKNEYKYTGFLGWLYDFLSFNKLMIDSLLKVLYLIIACFFTLGGFVLMFSSFLGGLFVMIFGNVMLRLVYEFAMLLIVICQNTSEINKKLGGNASTREFISTFGNPKKEDSAEQNPYQTPSSAQAPAAPTNTATTHTAFTATPDAQKSCNTCGAISSQEAIFCYNCGERL